MADVRLDAVATDVVESLNPKVKLSYKKKRLIDSLRKIRAFGNLDQKKRRWTESC